jgi:hypothetical protein
MKLLSLRALGALSLLLACGCNKLPFGGQKAGAGGAEAQAAAADPAASADDKLGEKLEEYLKGCLNNYVRTKFRDSADNYLQDVDEKKGPTEAHPPYLRNVDPKEVDECVQAAAKGKGMAPALPELDDAVAAFAAAIKAGTPLLNDAQTYYDQKNYKDDKMAKGQALHPQLVTLFKGVNSASHDMSEAFSKQKGPLDARELERLKTKGPKLAYVTKRSIMDSDTFAKMIDVKSVKEFFALPAPDLQAKVDVLAQDYSELKAIVDAKGKDLEGTSNVDSYTSALEKYLKTAKDVTRRIRDKTKFTDSELQRLGTSGGWMTDGSPDKLNQDHDSLISDYNRMRL